MPDELLSQVWSLLWLSPFALAVYSVSRLARMPFSRGAVVAYPVFVLFQTALVIALDCFGLLTRSSIFAVYSVLTLAGAAAAVTALRHAAAKEPELARGPIERLLGPCTLAVLLGLTAVKILFTPEEVFDTQTYHLPMVANWIQNASLSPWATQAPRQIIRAFAGEAQCYTVAALTMSDALVELPSLLAAAVFAACMAEAVRMRGGSRTLAQAAALVPFTAVMIDCAMGTAKNDVGYAACAMVALVALACLFDAQRERQAGWAALATLAAACAVGTKVPGITVAVSVAVIFLAGLLVRRIGLKAAFAAVAVFFAAAIPLFGFAWLRAHRLYGMSFGLQPSERSFFFDPAGNVQVAAHVYLKHFYVNLAANIQNSDSGHYGLLFSFVFLPAFIYGLLRAALRPLSSGRRAEGAPGVVAAFVLVNAAVLALSSRATAFDMRWMIWLVGALGVYFLLEHRAALERERALVLGLIAAFAISSVWAASAPSVAKCLWLTVREGRMLRSYDTMPWTKGYDLVDKVSGPRDELLYVGTEDSWQYPCWGPRFTRRVEGVSSGADAVEKLRRLPRFVVVEDAASQELKTVLAPGLAERYQVLYAGNARTIYIRPDGEGAAPRTKQ